MRLTVGPLPPAVYWRRRAIVLGGFLVVIILLVYSCGDSGEPNSGAKKAAATTSASPSPSATQSPPRDLFTDPPSPAPSSTPSSTPDSGLCTDEEMLVTPVPAARTLPRGATMQIILKIKNRSNRTCKRDVGADLQELYIVEQGGAQKIWSSDDCGGLRGHNVESFTPNFERAYTASWDGRESTNCKEKPIPVAGEYQLYGRLGTKRSAAVTLTLT